MRPSRYEQASEAVAPEWTNLGVLTLFSQFLLPRVRLQIFFGGLVPLIIALFLFSAMERADRFLNNRVTGFLGVLSYSLYLWQQPFLNRNSQGWWTEFPLNLALAFVCALASYYAVEKPFLRMYHATRERPSKALASAP
jgi:peptidoglycan/LPS O-acetylase OafA/YrhL